MTRRIPYILILSLLILAVSASSVFSDASPFAPKKRKPYNPIARAVLDYVIPETQANTSASASKGGYQDASLGASSPSASPGAILGATYYDYQANYYQGRMIRAGRNLEGADSLALIHSVFMNSNNATLGSGHRGPSYAQYDALAGVYTSEIQMTFDPQRSGYFNMEITKGNQAIVCGHYNPEGDVTAFDPVVWYDPTQDGGFSQFVQVPDEIQTVGNPYTGDAANIIWPHIAFQTRPTGQHITHVFAQTVGGNAVKYYFRKEGNTANFALGQLSSCASPAVSNWDCPYVVDTTESIAPGIEASKQSGKVALFYLANLPPPGGCDTCSDVNSPSGATDLYCQISTNYGVSWGPTKNITHTDEDAADWVPFDDFDGLWDDADELHIAWVGFNWARFRDQGESTFGCRVFHWRESFGTVEPNSGEARTVMQLMPDPDSCNGNPNNLHYGKINIAECNTNIYITAVDLWEGHAGPGIWDCSKRIGSGGVNGEIVVAISDDNGTTFDLPHNLTNSPTPECDSAGGTVGPCDADHWPSMIPQGFPTRTAWDDWSLVTDVFPRPVAYPDGNGVEWLHIQYVNDLDPGSPLFDASVGRDNPVRHFRMACVDPDQIPVIIYSISEITWPTFVKPDSQKNIPVLIENIGNASTTMNVTTDELTGPAGWLTDVGFAGSIGEGTNNKDTGNIHLDASGITQEKINEAGGTTIVFGEVYFDHQGPSDIDTMPVTLIVTDTILLPNWDTISTGVVSLRVGTNGQYGGGGIKGVSLDYWYSPLQPDCDTIDSIPGNTEVYVYDGSYAIGGIMGTDTIMSNQVFNAGPRNPSSVYQITAQSANVSTSGILQTWKSGRSVNSDTSLAFSFKWIAPQVTAQYGTPPGSPPAPIANTYWVADQQFVARELKVWSNDGAAHNGLAIGDFIDWDVPGDSGLAGNNTGDTSGVRRLLYQRGSERNEPSGDAKECQNNDTRFAGMAFAYLRAYWNHDNNGATAKQWTVRDSVGYGGYIDANARISFPLNGPDLYANMEANSGYHKWTHSHPDSQRIDLHSVLTPVFDYDLAVGDTVAVYTVYATVLEDVAGPSRIQDLATKGRNFAYYWGCCDSIKGDLNGNGGVNPDINDLNFLVNYIFRGGLRPACLGEADLNSDRQIAKITDLNFLVARIFRGGPPPAACSAVLP
jgi:hypothetical protein